ncbi:MAG: ATP-binding protein [Cryomorphaceae bacterium]
MIQRDIGSLLEQYSREFRAVMVVGPRQSGKTTLVRETFPDKPYVSLENPDERLLAQGDPRAFLNRFPEGAVLDEVQRVPELFNYLQEIIDNSDRDGLFILTGSNNILLQEGVSQSLAGRLGVLELMPLSYREVKDHGAGDATLNELVLKGGYPEIFHKGRKPELWYASYLRTYVERDVRQIKNVENSMLFTKFLKLCAGRIGQQLNVSSLSNECGIDVRTVQSWLSILEMTYVVKLLPPYYKNFNKRVVKSPKLFFYDTGLACTLLSIRKAGELSLSHFRGALVENYVIMECIKNNMNFDRGEVFYYWRENHGIEIDLMIDSASGFLPVEIKSAETFHPEFKKNILKIMDLSGVSEGRVLYDGAQEFKGSDGVEVMNWRSFVVG